MLFSLGMKGLAPSLNILSQVVSFGQEDKVHKDMQVSSLPMENKRKSCFLFTFICRFRSGLSAESLPFGCEGMAD